MIRVIPPATGRDSLRFLVWLAQLAVKPLPLLHWCYCTQVNQSAVPSSMDT